jgi:hypothetical protein
MASRTSFRFVHAVWPGDDRNSSASGAGDVGGDTGRVNVVGNGAGGEWDNDVDGSADATRPDRGLPVADGDFGLRPTSLRMCFIREIEI